MISSCQVDTLSAVISMGEVPVAGSSDWLKDNADGLGRRYISELRRNFRLPSRAGLDETSSLEA